MINPRRARLISLLVIVLTALLFAFSRTCQDPGSVAQRLHVPAHDEQGLDRHLPYPHSPSVVLAAGECNFGNVFSFGVRIQHANNGSQFCASPSTLTSVALLTSGNLCTGDSLGNISEAQCRSRRGGFLSVDERSHHSTNLNANDEGRLPFFTRDGLILDWQLMRQLDSAFINPPDASNHTNSHLGLGQGSTLLRYLKDSGYIRSRSWALDTVSSQLKAPRKGALILGGYSEWDFAYPWWHHYTINSPDSVQPGRHCPLAVVVSEISVTINGTTRLVLQEPAKACIEPYDRLFRLPSAQLGLLRNHIEDLTGLRSAAALDSRRIFTPELGLAYETSSSINASLSLRLSDGFSIHIPSEEFEQPLRGLNVSGAPAVNDSLRELQVLGLPSGDDVVILGRAFLSKALLSVDYDTNSFRLARPEGLDGIFRPVYIDFKEARLHPETKGLIAIGIVVFGQVQLCLIIGIWYSKNPTPSSMLAIEPGDWSRARKTRSLTECSAGSSRRSKLSFIPMIGVYLGVSLPRVGVGRLRVAYTCVRVPSWLNNDQRTNRVRCG
ncbi:hypothetical protein QBC34DRAFT_302262 [Podospora aff. communis PSN243]|uniref:Peptidase A1 domain-containing protein n=1 Tax=Podospora aff. communis PSN243 TaxID=3040156 RepID=A0AAV9GJ67_9PEZI|nr:hypothetical protein QBC34DRAFT_302262 [Podospora aff. communis PSN243]